MPRYVKEVAKKTDDVAGDGATTATVLAQALVREGLRNVAASTNPIALKKGIEKAVEAVTAALLAQAKDVETKEEIAATAAISAGDQAIGDLIAEALDKVGKEGVITVEESSALGLKVEFTEGMRFDKGFLSAYFVTDPEREAILLEDTYVLLVESKISNVKDLLPLLEKVIQAGKPLFIVAEDVEGEALATLIINKIRGLFKSVAVKAPGFGDRRKAMLQDMAILTGGQVVCRRPWSSDTVGLEVLGTARKIVVTKDETTIVEGSGDAAQIQGRVSQIRAEIDNSDSDYDREKLQERLAEAAGGVAVIKAGAATEVEAEERKHRIRGRRATRRRPSRRASSPVVAWRSSRSARPRRGPQARATRRPVRRIAVKLAIEAPLKHIAINVGSSRVASSSRRCATSPWVTASTLRRPTRTRPAAAGVNDPVKVTRFALENAASIAALFLTTEAVVADKPERNPAPAGGAARTSAVGSIRS